MSASTLVQAWKGQFSSRDGSSVAGGGAEIDPQDVDQVVRHTITYTKTAADAMAADVTSAQNILYLDTATLDTGVTAFPNGIKIESVSVTTQANVTANATNYFTLIVEKATGAGAATTVASYAANVVTTNDLTALVAKAVPLTASAAILTSGQSLNFRISKTGTGLVAPVLRIQVLYRVL